ncbi:carboxymuconolactone decarboxylase family protein [Marinomonas balearica]|uniref:4-carboxymuconolactone decarboxylase n=1 Tax=Marinomonas balearica TaxID=491947 RepID=A0A4R6MGZ2_9GAMM|nr:carboxymuconolactone decarboxylase family protein [Marinomonas balearica]TDP01199.1 4-carboxymuconolactone decarboxylase [Marinomonas balearica]
MGRISLPTREVMSAAQKVVYDSVVAGPRGVVVGPLRAAIHNPDLADRWQKLGKVLRYETSLPLSLNELAIVLTARRWNAQVEWSIHAKEAEKAGLSTDVIEAIRTGSKPDFTNDTSGEEVYCYAREILMNGTSQLETYKAIVARWGEKGVVELTAVIGYYSMVAMTLNTHEIPMPEGLENQLDVPDSGLYPIPELA